MLETGKMNFDIGFEAFRGFRNQAYIPIRPITVLIGENSSGKTSLLALIKYVYDIISGKIDASFNDEQFQLGTFDQIAYNRGEEEHSSNQITFKVRKTVSTRDIVKGRNKPSESDVELIVILSGLDSDTVLNGFEFNVRGTNLQVQVGPKAAPWKFTDVKGSTINIPNLSLPFHEVLRGAVLRYVPLMINQRLYPRWQENGGSKSKGKELPVWVGQFFEALVDEFTANVVITSAIRTKPFRTYTPGTEKEDSEGSHVPFELAKLERRDKSEWNVMRSRIEKFGVDSEMFNEIGVKNFGPRGSDPFQIQFDLQGVRRNLIDLGYGTSQVLPILYNAATSETGASFLIQQPEVHLHPKAQAVLAQYFIDAFIDHRQNFVLETHSDFIVDRIRTAILSNKINKDDVSILFFNREKYENIIHHIELDENGDPISPPENYRKFFTNEQMRILGVPCR